MPRDRRFQVGFRKRAFRCRRRSKWPFGVAVTFLTAQSCLAGRPKESVRWGCLAESPCSASDKIVGAMTGSVAELSRSEDCVPGRESSEVSRAGGEGGRSLRAARVPGARSGAPQGQLRRVVVGTSESRLPRGARPTAHGPAPAHAQGAKEKRGAAQHRGVESRPGPGRTIGFWRRAGTRRERFVQQRQPS
jgi:hypothetical protein